MCFAFLKGGTNFISEGVGLKSLEFRASPQMFDLHKFDPQESCHLSPLSLYISTKHFNSEDWSFRQTKYEDSLSLLFLVPQDGHYAA